MGSRGAQLVKGNKENIKVLDPLDSMFTPSKTELVEGNNIWQGCTLQISQLPNADMQRRVKKEVAIGHRNR
jgi:hypothetical protein